MVAVGRNSRSADPETATFMQVHTKLVSVLIKGEARWAAPEVHADKSFDPDGTAFNPWYNLPYSHVMQTNTFSLPPLIIVLGVNKAT